MDQMAERRSLTQIALGSFFTLAALFCSLAAFTLTYPETWLSAVWHVKPDAFAQLLLLRPWTVAGFVLLSALMAVTAWGCFQRRRWGWRMAIAIFAANAAGDFGQILAGRIFEGALGIFVVVAIVLYLTRPRVKAEFQ